VDDALDLARAGRLRAMARLRIILAANFGRFAVRT